MGTNWRTNNISSSPPQKNHESEKIEDYSARDVEREIHALLQMLDHCPRGHDMYSQSASAPGAEPQPMEQFQRLVTSPLERASVFGAKPEMDARSLAAAGLRAGLVRGAGFVAQSAGDTQA